MLKKFNSGSKREKALAGLVCLLFVVAALVPFTFAAFAGSLGHPDVAAAPTDVSDKLAAPEDESAAESDAGENEGDDAEADGEPADSDADNEAAAPEENAAEADEDEDEDEYYDEVEAGSEDDAPTMEEIWAYEFVDGDSAKIDDEGAERNSSGRKRAIEPESTVEPQADAAYAILDGGTLTIKYGDSSSETATVYSINPASNYTSSNTPWNSQKSGISTVVIDSSISNVASVNMRYWFYNCTNLTSVSGLSNLGSSVTNLSYTFGNCGSLASLDLSGLDTSSTTTMQNMVNSSCTSLTSVTFGSSFDVLHISTATNRITLPTPSGGACTGSWRKQGTNIAYNATNLRTLPAADLEGTWIPDTRQVTYNANTGSGSIDSEYAAADGSVTLSDGAGFSKTAAHLTGWNTNAGGTGTHYDLGDSATLTNSNLDLHAEWADNDFTSPIDPPSGTFTYDGTAQTPSITVNGYDGKTTLAEGTDYTVTWSNNTDPGTASGIVKGMGDYVNATDQTVTFTIDPKSATITAADQTVIAGNAIDTSLDKATLADAANGHSLSEITLTGSDTSSATTIGTITPSAAKIVDSSGADVTSNYAITYANGTLTVRAGYLVTYDANGGTGAVAAQETSSTGAITLSDGGDLTRSGYTFASWNTIADGSGTPYDGGADATFTDDTILYAQWEKNPVQGTVKPTVAKGSWGNARLTTSGDDLANAIDFTDEESELIENGTIAFVYVRASDASSSASDSLKAKLAAAPGDGYTLGACIDITLYVRVGDLGARKVTDADDTLTVAIDLPSELIADDPGDRTYAVAREHDGAIGKVKSSFDGKSTLSFDSSQFSTFGIDYTDEATASVISVDGASGNDATASPSLGDNNPLQSGSLLAIALSDCVLIAYGVARLRRRFDSA